ncbi:hypothetical protein GGR57DRAFT_453077 [Xylariaceae sp. FL1272]|nr:hypothetical protein GGR57DRAFT_453077 [Xylariaceae sp. FL1272]
MAVSPNDNLDLYPPHVDDWHGISSARERRKIQNRVNQRLRRSRARKASQVPVAPVAPVSYISYHQNNIRNNPLQILLGLLTTSANNVDVKRVVEAISVFDTTSPYNRSLVHALEVFMRRNWLIRAPRPDLIPSLMQFNFIKALFRNAEVLNLTDGQLKDDDALSNFNTEGPPRVGTQEVCTLPTHLQPTILQVRTVHHPWFDLLPMAQMRDNLLLRGVDSFDDYELCYAMRGRGDRQSAGFLIWGEPWDASCWEVTEGFAKSSWSWTIAGCWDLWKSTNTWRAKRGEPPLFYNTSIQVGRFV